MAQYWYNRAFNANNPDESERAQRMLLNVMDKRAKLLGLYVTNIKQDITINEGGNEFNERVRELAYLVAQNRTDSSGLDGGITPILGGNSPT